jgi:hypothetical protein
MRVPTAIYTMDINAAGTQALVSKMGRGGGDLDTVSLIELTNGVVRHGMALARVVFALAAQLTTLCRAIPSLSFKKHGSNFADQDEGRRMALTFPLFPPPQKNRSPPSDSNPETPVPTGISSRSSTSPVAGSMRRTSLASSCQVPCQSSPSTQVTPVTN